MNLLFVFTDEQRADTMRAYGNAAMETPHLDALAAESVVFDRCYCTQSVCTPSRASILTGRWPHTCGCTRNNVPLPADVPCLPEMTTGYRTAYFGKWHLGDEIFAQHGFEHWVSIEDMYRKHYREGRDRDARSTYHHWLAEKGYAPNAKDGVFSRSFAARLPEGHCKPAYLAYEFAQWLKALPQGEPFIAYINFLEPHMPFYGPRDGQYDPAALDLPPNFDHPPDASNHPKTRLLYEKYQGGYDMYDLSGERGWRELIANYRGLVSQVDAALGDIREALRNAGAGNDTVIVFTSDHGDMMGSHQLLAKTVQFEEAVRVPLLIRAPGVAPRHESQPVSQIDLAPTLLDLLGAPAPSELQGQSLRGLIERREPPEYRDVFIEWTGPDCGLSALERDTSDEVASAVNDPIRTVITADGWKLNHSAALGRHELFNLAGDPYELMNLFGRPGTKSRVEDLKYRLRAWGVRANDPVAAGI